MFALKSEPNEYCTLLCIAILVIAFIYCYCKLERFIARQETYFNQEGQRRPSI